MKIWAIVKSCQFRGVHHYPEGAKLTNEIAQTIQHPHTHIFHVEVRIAQDHSNRDVEYLSLENDIEYYIGELKKVLKGNPSMSCEHMGEYFYNKLKKIGAYKNKDIIIDVLEDGKMGTSLGDY